MSFQGTAFIKRFLSNSRDRPFPDSGGRCPSPQPNSYSGLPHLLSLPSSPIHNTSASTPTTDTTPVEVPASSNMECDLGESEEVSSRARVWTSALNKQASFARQAESSSARTALPIGSDRGPALNRYSVELSRAPFHDDMPLEDPALPPRARTSIDVEENSFVLQPLDSFHLGGPSAPDVQRREIGQRRGPGQQNRNRRIERPSNPNRAPRAGELHGRIHNQEPARQEKSFLFRLYGNRERPASTPMPSPNARGRGGPFLSPTNKGVRSRTWESDRGVQSPAGGGGSPDLHRQDSRRPNRPRTSVDGPVLSRGDSFFARARRVLTTPSPRGQAGRQDPTQESTGGPHSFRREGRPHRTASPTEVRPRSSRVAGRQQRRIEDVYREDDILGQHRYDEPDSRQRGEQYERVERLEKAGRGDSPSAVQGGSHSQPLPSGTRALHTRVRALESELAAAVTESSRMATLITELREEIAQTKSAAPMLEDVLRKSRVHFESKERALKMMIDNLDRELTATTKVNTELSRKLSLLTEHSTLPSGDSVRSRSTVTAASDGERADGLISSYDSSAAERRLQELEELSGPLSSTRRDFEERPRDNRHEHRASVYQTLD